MNDGDESSSLAAFEALLAYFSRNADASPERIIHPDSGVNRIMEESSEPLRKASVLIPVTRHRPGSASEVILTVRTENLSSHAGQICLPGGSEEDADADAIATALRESEEEIGLGGENVQILGRLGDMRLPSGFQVTPVVGIIEPGLEFAACPIEVAEIFHVPLSLIANADAYTASSMFFANESRKILELQYERFRIWGATAAILHNLAQAIAEPQTRD